MSNLPTIEVFLRADPLESVVASDPPVEVNQPIFQTINPGNFATAAQGELAETAVQPEEIANFETTTQLNARDAANRDRSNHTGTQSITTITGLETALAGKASALQGAKADTALQPGNNISLLTNNVGFITENIPDGSRINGVAYFCRPTQPTQRTDGSPLQVNDRCYRTDLRVDTFWDGVNWVGVQKSVNYNANSSTLLTSLVNQTLPFYPPLNSGFLLIDFIKVAYWCNPSIIPTGSFTLSATIRQYIQGSDPSSSTRVIYNYPNTFDIVSRMFSIFGSFPNTVYHDMLIFNGGILVDSDLIDSYFCLTSTRVGNSGSIRLKCIDMFYKEVYT